MSRVSQKARFEVFKRDKFTCQYCGAKAPDVVLHVDHVHPKSKGGSNDILNLVAACSDCNGGKGARLLDDASVVERQRAQLEELEERREQLAMMLQWRDELERVKTDTVQMIADRVCKRGGWLPNESGRSNIRKWLKRYEFDEVLAAVDESFDVYMRWNGDDPDEDAWEVAFHKIPAVAGIRRQSVEKPYLQRLFYIQGILRRRFNDKYGKYVQALEEMVLEWDAEVDLIEDIAKKAADWDDFCRNVQGFAASAKRAKEAESGPNS